VNITLWGCMQECVPQQFTYEGRRGYVRVWAVITSVTPFRQVREANCSSATAIGTHLWVWYSTVADWCGLGLVGQLAAIVPTGGHSASGGNPLPNLAQVSCESAWLSVRSRYLPTCLLTYLATWPY
jgi:hypothetical protein